MRARGSDVSHWQGDYYPEDEDFVVVKATEVAAHKLL